MTLMTSEIESFFFFNSEGGFCGSYDAYSNNTYVAKYIDWITSNVKGDFICAK